MSRDHETLTLRGVAIGAALDRLDVPAQARPKIRAKLMGSSFPLNTDFHGERAQKTLVKQAATAVSAADVSTFSHDDYAAMRQSGLIG